MSDALEDLLTYKQERKALRTANRTNYGRVQNAASMGGYLVGDMAGGAVSNGNPIVEVAAGMLVQNAAESLAKDSKAKGKDVYDTQMARSAKFRSRRDVRDAEANKAGLMIGGSVLGTGLGAIAMKSNRGLGGSVGLLGGLTAGAITAAVANRRNKKLKHLYE